MTNSGAFNRIPAMSAPGWYDPDEAVLQPQRGRRETQVPPAVLLTYTRLDFLEACQLTQAREPGRTWLDCPWRQGYWRAVPLAVVGPAPGAPYAVMVLEKLIALGGRCFVACGWCGSLRPEVRIGDLVLPELAYSEEGTSRHYPPLPAGPRPDPDLRALLEAELAAQGIFYHRGEIWTTDAIYRETKRKVREYGAAGRLAVEMELAALFTVAAYRRVSLAGLLVVSDELHSLSWRHGYRDERLAAGRRQALTLALEVLARRGATLGQANASAPDLGEKAAATDYNKLLSKS